MFFPMFGAIMNLLFKGHKCRTAQMDASDYIGLKSETTTNWKFRGSRR